MTSITVAKPNIAPTFTRKLAQVTPVASIPTATGSETFRDVYGTMPVSRPETSMYKTVHITSDPRIPIGMSLCGFFDSCAAVDTASKPM